MTFIVAEMKRKICASLFVCLAAFAYRNNKLNNIILIGLSITPSVVYGQLTQL